MKIKELILLVGIVCINVGAWAECPDKGFYEVQKELLQDQPESITHGTCNVYLLKSDKDLWATDPSRVQVLVDKGYLPVIIDAVELPQKAKLGDLVAHFENYKFDSFCMEGNTMYYDARHRFYESFNLQSVIRVGEQPLYKDLAYSFMTQVGYFVSAADTANPVMDFVYSHIPKCVAK